MLFYFHKSKSHNSIHIQNMGKDKQIKILYIYIYIYIYIVDLINNVFQRYDVYNCETKLRTRLLDVSEFLVKM